MKKMVVRDNGQLRKKLIKVEVHRERSHLCAEEIKGGFHMGIGGLWEKSFWWPKSDGKKAKSLKTTLQQPIS